MIIVGATSNTSIDRNKTIKSLSLSFRLVLNAPNVAIAVMPNYTNCSIKVTLTRNGTNHTIINENLQNLNSRACYFDMLEQAYINFCAIMRVYYAAGITGQYVIPLVIDLPGPINLTGSDSLVTEISINSGFYAPAGGNINGTGSTLDFNWLTCDGTERMIPMIRCYMVQPNVSNQPFSLGDNVKEIVCMNFDKGWAGYAGELDAYLPLTSSTADSNQVVTNFSMQSNTTQFSETSDRFLLRIPQLFTTSAESNLRGQSVYMSFKKYLDNCNLNITFNTANVNGSQNLIWCGSFFHDKTTIERSVNKDAKDHQVNISKVVSASPAAAAHFAKNGTPASVSGS